MKKTSAQKRNERQFFSQFRWMPCTACASSGETIAHHVHTKKARPDLKFDPRNLMPLCVFHHHDIHLLGMNAMVEEYIEIQSWLIENGWEYCQISDKWFLPSY